jgi:hypothetical protein
MKTTKQDKIERLTRKYKINWTGIILIFLINSIFAFLIIGLPEKVCLINCDYGIWASYVVMGCLSYLFLKDIRLTKERAEEEVR